MTGGTAIAHGGRLDAARRQWPDAPQPWIDLSTGINPHPYPVGPLTPADLCRLPEPESVQRLQEVAAAAYGVADAEMVVAAPGTQILISLLPWLLRASDVAVLGPTYAEHAASWAAGGARVSEVAELSGLAGAHSAVVVNPNNPDGRRHAPGDLVRLAAGLGGCLVVDEAFADLEGPGVSVAPALPCAGLVVLRSFGKTYGLAGLRLGFLLAEPGLAARVRAALGPWAVSGPALAAGLAALADPAWRDAAAVRCAQDAVRLDALLGRAGMVVVGGTRLFRLAEVAQAPAWHDRLGRAGILVRRFVEQPRWLRFGLPADAAAWDRLERCLRCE